MLMEEKSIDVSALSEQADELRSDGATVIFIAVDGKPAGLLAIADPIKKTTPAAIKALHEQGIRIVMLTGDNRRTAEAVAKTLGIEEVEAEILPEDKSRIVKKLREEGKVVAMAGDGTNDAPALAAADVGIAMGTGTDVAMESAGVTLLKGDLIGIVRARKLSVATMNNKGKTCSLRSSIMRRVYQWWQAFSTRSLASCFHRLSRQQPCPCLR